MEKLTIIKMFYSNIFFVQYVAELRLQLTYEIRYLLQIHFLNNNVAYRIFKNLLCQHQKVKTIITRVKTITMFLILFQ